MFTLIKKSLIIKTNKFYWRNKHENYKLNEVNYLRGEVISAEIDDTNLDFRNGIAVVKASIATLDFYRRKGHYESWGLINESYEEEYEDKSNLFERNLMFVPFNKNIVRCGDNDFIVEVTCRDDNRIWTEYRHIRIVDGVPTLINRNIGGCQKTSLENIIIAGFNNKTLYDTNEGRALTPPLAKIEESQEEEIFNVVAKIEVDSSYCVDYLFFKVNRKGIIVSRVLSSLANGFLGESYISIDDLLSKRQAQLIMIRDSFNRALDSFINSEVSPSNPEDKERIRGRIK